MAEPLTQDQIIALIRRELDTRNAQEVPAHSHNGVDTPQIDPTFFLGFPIFAAAPTHTAPDGTIVLSDTGSTRKIHARIAGVWYAATLT